MIPSLNNASPKTVIKSVSLTFISSKTAITATGSTALINAEKRKISKIENLIENIFNKPSPYNDEPKIYKIFFIVHTFSNINFLISLLIINCKRKEKKIDPIDSILI